MRSVFSSRMVIVSALAAASISLAGCAGTTGLGGASNADKLQTLMAQNAHVSKEDVKITDVKSDRSIMGNSTTYFTATIGGKVQHCYVTSSLLATSSPLCNDAGKNASDGDNALIKAARQKGLAQ